METRCLEVAVTKEMVEDSDVQHCGAGLDASIAMAMP